MERKLQRRPFLGVRMGDPGEEFSNVGLRVAGIVPQSIAELAGLAAGDTVLAIGGIKTTSTAALRLAMQAIRDKTAATIAFERDSEQLSSQVDVCRWPLEILAAGRVVYDQVNIGGVALRTIITEPDTPGPHPAVLFLQGIRRGTVDLPFSPHAPLRQLAHGLVARGIATMRLERRGIGDSEGGPFDALNFETEAGDVAAALSALAARNTIDKNRIALFGHSTGGMICPIVARHDIARSFVVFGTASSGWFDCIRSSSRHQVEVKGQDIQAETIRGELERDLDSINSGREPMLFGRCAAFHNQLDNANLKRAWSEVRAPVLVLHGEHDWVVNAADAGELVSHLKSCNIAVGYHELEGLDHAMTSHSSQAASVAHYGAGRFDDRLVDCVVAWLEPDGSLGT